MVYLGRIQPFILPENLLSDRNHAPLSGGSPFLVLSAGSAIDIHTVGAAVPGRLRGAIVHLHVSNSNAESSKIELSDGTGSEVIAIPAFGFVEMDFWLDAGVTLTGQASDTGIQVMGFAQPIA